MISRLKRTLYSLVRIATAGYILGIMLLLLTYSTPADAANIVIEYREAKSTDLKKIRTSLIEARFLEKTAAKLESDHIKFGLSPLLNTLTLVTDECTSESAYYRPKTKTITLCYELVQRIISKAEKETGIESERGFLGAGALGFIFLHELGHAYVDLLDLKFAGREEDVADQIAAISAFNSPLELQKPLIIGGIWFFERKGNASYSKEDFANEHSLNDQRFYNLMCWAYGYDSSLYAVFKKFLKDDRALGCGDEYKKMREGLLALGQFRNMQQMSGDTSLSSQQKATHFSAFPLVVNQVYDHPNYPMLAFGFGNNMFLAMDKRDRSFPIAMLEIGSLPEGQWLPVTSLSQQQLPIMIMRRGYSLTAQWLP